VCTVPADKDGEEGAAVEKEDEDEDEDEEEEASTDHTCTSVCSSSR
jgi:hypothetical protein